MKASDRADPNPSEIFRPGPEPDSPAAEAAASAIVSLAAGATELDVATELDQTRWTVRQAKTALRRWVDRRAARRAAA